MEQYNVTLEIDIRSRAFTTELASTLLDKLAQYSPALSTSPHGRVQAILTVPGDTLVQAITTAVALTEHATGRRVLELVAMTTEEFDRRLGLEAVPELVSVVEAAELLGISRQRVLQLVDAGQIPAQRVGKAVVIARAAVMARTVREGDD